jgi:Holliday junction resolvase RusA-like endonuclease
MKLSIDIKPIGKASVRVTKWGAHMPQKTKDFMNTIAWEFKQRFVGHQIILKPIKLTITATFEPPKSYSNKKRLLALEGKLLYTKKPDGSNIAKGVEDALNGVAFKDDSQVCDLRVIKQYGIKNNVTIEIEQLTNV